MAGHSNVGQFSRLGATGRDQNFGLPGNCDFAGTRKTLRRKLLGRTAVKSLPPLSRRPEYVVQRGLSLSGSAVSLGRQYPFRHRLLRFHSQYLLGERLLSSSCQSGPTRLWTCRLQRPTRTGRSALLRKPIRSVHHSHRTLFGKRLFHSLVFKSSRRRSQSLGRGPFSANLHLRPKIGRFKELSYVYNIAGQRKRIDNGS